MDFHYLDLENKKNRIERKKKEYEKMFLSMKFLLLNLKIKQIFNLSFSETLIYSFLENFNTSEWIEITNEILSKILDLSVWNISKSLWVLKEKKLIDMEIIHDKYETIRTIYILDPFFKF